MKHKIHIQNKGWSEWLEECRFAGTTINVKTEESEVK